MDISLLNVEPQVGLVIVLIVIAVIKLVDQLFDRDWAGASKIIGAALVGLIVALGVDGLTSLVGIAYGLSASGLITAVGHTKKTTPVDTLG